MSPLIPIVSTFLAIFTIVYVVFLTRVGIGLQRLRRQPQSAERPFVSVVIAARNEAQNITACVRSVLAQDYSEDRYEIIIVDDRSTDGTADAVASLNADTSRLRLVPSSSNGQSGAVGKSAALRTGIAIARGELIATTDADCIVISSWISSMVASFVPGVGIVSGPVVEDARPTLFSRMEALEFFGLIAVGAGLIGSNRPIICNGANLAFRRSAFDAVGGYGDGPHANDDEGLMNRIVSRGAGRAAFAATAGALVRTTSDNTPWTFYWQRVRWSAKRGHYEDRSIIAMLVSLYSFFLALLIGFVSAFLEPLLILPVAIVLTGKLVLEYLTLRAAASLFQVRIPLLPFLIAEVFHVPYIVSAAAIGQFVRSPWKG